MSGPPSPSNTELATFQIFSNTDYVDLGKLARAAPPMPLRREKGVAIGARDAFSAAVDTASAAGLAARRASVGSSASRNPALLAAQAAPAPFAEEDSFSAVLGFNALGPNALGLHEVSALEARGAAAPWDTQSVAPQFAQEPLFEESAPKAPARDEGERMQTPQRPANQGMPSLPPSRERASDWDAQSAGSMVSAAADKTRAAPAAESSQERAERRRSAFQPPPLQHDRRFTEDTDENAPEVIAEKEALLGELKSMERQGTARLARDFSMQDTLQALQFEYERIQSDQSASQTVEMAKGGIRMGVGVLEMFLKRYGLTAIDGWYNQACGDMTKYNRPLHKLYKKYWRRAPSSPITEIAYLILGSAAWTVVQNKVMGGGNNGTAAPVARPEPTAAPPAPSGVQASYEAPSDRRDAAPPRPMRPPQKSAVAASSWSSLAAANRPEAAPAVTVDRPAEQAGERAAEVAAAAATATAAAAAAANAREQAQALVQAAQQAQESLKREREALQTEKAELRQREAAMLEALDERIRRVESVAAPARANALLRPSESESEDVPSVSEVLSLDGARMLTLEGTTSRRKTGTASRRAKSGSAVLRL